METHVFFNSYVVRCLAPLSKDTLMSDLGKKDTFLKPDQCSCCVHHFFDCSRSRSGLNRRHRLVRVQLFFLQWTCDDGGGPPRSWARALRAVFPRPSLHPQRDASASPASLKHFACAFTHGCQHRSVCNGRSAVQSHVFPPHACGEVETNPSRFRCVLSTVSVSSVFDRDVVASAIAPCIRWRVSDYSWPMPCPFSHQAS